MQLPPELIVDLQKSLRGSLRTDRTSRILYSTDASIYQIEPLGVVIPRDQEDLQCVVEVSAKYKVPLLPRGSGSSLAGQAIGPALIIDCSRWLDHILEVNPEERSATVEPGVILASLNKEAAAHGLQFGPDPASAERATLGGVISNNATGAHSIQYGMSADHVLSAEVLLSDGSPENWGEIPAVDAGPYPMPVGRMGELLASVREIRQKYAHAIRQGYPGSWRNSAGYRLNYLLPWSGSCPPQWEGEVYPPARPGSVNLAALLAGSEGTLAVIRRLKLNLVPRPAHTVLAVLAYDGIAEACDDIPRLLQFKPSAIELVPHSIVRLARSVPAYAAQAAIIDLPAEALLVVELSGSEPQALRRSAQALQPALIAESPADQKRIWNVRKVGLGLLASRPGEAKTAAFIEDCAIPVEHLGDFVRGVQQILRDFGAEAEFYAHASAGCLHIRPILDLKQGMRSMRGIAEAVLTLTLSLGGSMSSEHGDGLARSEWLRETYGEELLEAFRVLKQAADPAGLLNPGKILDAPRMDSNLRFGEAYQARAWDTRLDFSPEGGLAGAIEQCNGQGVCRKFDGTMCPSFQATREEMNSTRGRANLLRAMISQPAQPQLDGEVFSALDLCLACKGCKSECPSGVDMAKLKFAFQAEYFRHHPRALRDYVFGYFHSASALLAALAPLANAVMRFAPARRLIAAVTGITPHRPFPAYSRSRARIPLPPDPEGAPRVLFLRDAFTHFIEPRVEQAAFDLLAAAGYRIIVLPAIGAGASLLSKGFLRAAQLHASRLLKEIQQADPEGECMILGIEPPDIYVLKNDLDSLLPERRTEIEAVSGRTWLLDEFLIRSERFHQMRIAIRENAEKLDPARKAFFQPHCHQRAEKPAADGYAAGADATMVLLSGCGFDIDLIDAGCCGMAGTFGYEREHYKLSMQVGQLRLFPFIGAAKRDHPGSIFLSTGSACRMQIEQGSHVEVQHPILFLRNYLE